MKMMRTVNSGRWAPALVSLLMFALLCGLLVYWAMQLLAPPVTIAPSGSLVGNQAAIDTSSARTLFGSADGRPAAAPPRRASVKVDVFGVVASAERAAAILGIDGKPAQAYGVGQPIDGDEDFTITEVSASEVVLDRGGEEIRVEVQSGGDLAVLTSGQNESAAAATAAPANTRSTGARRPGNNRTRNGARGASRPTLAPRRLPPSGAAAAAAAARNTTGVPTGNTPGAGRPAGTGRPGGQAANGQQQPPRTRLGSPANAAIQNNNGNQAK
jgi:general secretion pathway protein C